MKTNLFTANDPNCWHLYSWKQFCDFENKSNTTIILPVIGFTDWKLGYGLNAEENILLPILAESLKKLDNQFPILVAPPIRFGLAPFKNSFFGLDPDTAHEQIENLIESFQASGFRKILFLNSSPWNEPFVDAAGRDTRVKFNVQPFCINLSGIGIDLEATSESNLASIQSLLAHTTRKNPKAPFNGFSRESGDSLFRQSSEDLCGLLKEINDRAPLPNNGIIPNKLDS